MGLLKLTVLKVFTFCTGMEERERKHKHVYVSEKLPDAENCYEERR